MRAAETATRFPDTLILKGGREVHGLILKNTAKDVLIQERYGEFTYPKSEIVRILDEPDVGIEYADAFRKGELPSWRVIVNDLRTNDAVKSFMEIPAVRVETGEFRNVPYKSFRINGFIELNIYGDPEKPAGIELGIYGLRQGVGELRRTLRSYLAGFLTSREEVAALYDIDFRGGSRQVGDLTFEITPHTADDAFGAWWVGMHNRRMIEDVRLDEQEYAAITKPVSEVLNRRGMVKSTDWDAEDIDLAGRADSGGDDIIFRGFYRDSQGRFRVVGSRSE